jgi:hypothetical protein
MTGGQKCVATALGVVGIVVGVRFVRGALADILGDTSVLKPKPREHRSVVDYVDMAINMTQSLRH